MGIRAPLPPPIQYPVRPAAHVTANVHVPTSDHPNAAGPRTSTSERRSAIVQPTIANVRPHIGITRYKGKVMYSYRMWFINCLKWTNNFSTEGPSSEELVCGQVLLLTFLTLSVTT